MTPCPTGIIFAQSDIGEHGETWWYVYPSILCEDPEWWDDSLWECDMEREPLAGPFDAEGEAVVALAELEALGAHNRSIT